MKHLFIMASTAFLLTAACSVPTAERIDRHALVTRNNPHITSPDTLASLSVGNGNFAFTVDVTGLQTYPEAYRLGIPLGTQSTWGWHSFPNPELLQPEEAWVEYDFGHGHPELYATQPKEPGRAHDAAEWYRVNPHRLHLGCLGFAWGEGEYPAQLNGISQELDLWQGLVSSRFTRQDTAYTVLTVCDPYCDRIGAKIISKGQKDLLLRLPYPTGGHSDDGCDWTKDDLHVTVVDTLSEEYALMHHLIDGNIYYVRMSWKDARLEQTGRNRFLLRAGADTLDVSCEFLRPSTVCYYKGNPDYPAPAALVPCRTFDEMAADAASYWKRFWTEGAAVDFSACTDPRAKELERRVVLSQYLTAIQCTGANPPQETGLTYNSWFGKFHLEMVWWHQAHFGLWGRERVLESTLEWYHSVRELAREIARRQGFEGIRWMKMTDPDGGEAPSKVGSFLIWQQPHPIYLAELLYRASDNKEAVLADHSDLVQETAEFMYSFATRDSLTGRYLLKGAIPAQETLRAAETVNPPFELSYWHYAMQAAQAWRERQGMARVAEWDELIEHLSPLACNEEGLYLAAETAPETYTDIRFTSDHPAVLGAVGILPMSRLVREDYMRNTLHWVLDHWNWDKTWGWDFPMTAMNAARMGEPEKAVEALLMDRRTNTYLPNGHNYQDGRLRLYLPGNGGLLTAVAMMCAGWDGSKGLNPGFPQDGTWEVRWEGLQPMP